MSFPLLTKKQLILLGLLLCIASSQSAFAMDSRFEFDSKELESAAGKNSRSGRRIQHNQKKSPEAESRGIIHTVHPGDNILKILIHKYGLSNKDAESSVEEIRRENNIYDIKRLKVGQRIVIPMLHRKADGSVKKMPAVSTPEVTQSLKLDSPVEPFSEQEASQRIRQTWDLLISPITNNAPVSISSPSFSLTLDPIRYPVYPTLDGGKIIVDSAGSIPPLVKSLITEKDPSIKIISESSTSNKRFLTSLLGAAGFYSLEENFSMDFGTDPKLTVNADFKIEKNKNSLLQQDLTLVNTGRDTMPPAIVELLKKEGFTLHEPFASLKTFVVGTPRQLVQIKVKSQPEIVDAILGSLSIKPSVDLQMNVFATDNNGISLSVKAERYFERTGKRFVITRFDGDPITYTLFRILETKGYQVVILDQKDDFKKVSEKMFSRMNMNSSYRQYPLLKNAGSNYQLQMSGVMLEGGAANDIFFTNLSFDKTIHDLLTENGYTVIKR